MGIRRKRPECVNIPGRVHTKNSRPLPIGHYGIIIILLEEYHAYRDEKKGYSEDLFQSEIG